MLKLKKQKKRGLYLILVLFLILGIAVLCGLVYRSLTFRTSMQKTLADAQVVETEGTPHVSKQPDTLSFVWQGHLRHDTIVGTIVNIDWSGSVVNNVSYQVKLVIAVGSKGDQMVYYFNQSDYPKFNIVRIVQGKREPLDFKALQPGDKVDMSVTLDLLKPENSNLIGLTITKI